uniref:Biogenesis of lysosome-related organelles complex 1 subunit 3 n=1 Tax=Loa loa TaxID=7209 RepID=A0A1I7V5E2_LOALO
MSTESAILINVDQSSTSDADAINNPEAGCDDTNSGDSNSTLLKTEKYSLQTHNFDQALLNANKMEQTDFQNRSIGAADPVLESSKLLRKLSEAFDDIVLREI